MCGRYASFRQAQAIADEFDVVTLSQASLEVEPSWNIPPTTSVRIIIDRPAAALERFGGQQRVPGQQHRGSADDVVRALHAARWGLVPPWADSLAMGARMINARSETVATKASFRKPFATSRCLVVADGYYEWHTGEDGKKTPHYIYPTDGASLAFAGLFSWWRDPDVAHGSPDAWVLTTTILTAAARDGLEEIHDREPVMLSPEFFTPWLDPRLTDPVAALEIVAAPGPELSWHPVAPAVGSVRNNSPQLITPAPPPAQGTLL